MKNLSDGFFSIDSKNGFLPIKEPLRKLPSRYETLQQLIDEMPVLKEDGNPGILANHGSIEEAIKILPNYLDLVKLEKDSFVNFCDPMSWSDFLERHTFLCACSNSSTQR